MNLAPTSGHRGFTLIELLVVIAIIGILSAVVLASLNTARNKGADAAIKSNLQTIQTQAELFYDNNGNKYNTDGSTAQALGACPASGNTMFNSESTIKNAIASAFNAVGATIATTTCYMNAAGTEYFIQVPLKTLSSANTVQYYCVDSTGQATTTTTKLTSGTRCAI